MTRILKASNLCSVMHDSLLFDVTKTPPPSSYPIYVRIPVHGLHLAMSRTRLGRFGNNCLPLARYYYYGTSSRDIKKVLRFRYLKLTKWIKQVVIVY